MSVSIVTCGPSATRIDSVRRITNFSTGELGSLIAEELSERGEDVIVLRGEGATWAAPSGMEVRSFFSNEDLLEFLRQIGSEKTVEKLFHAAALTDFVVTAVGDAYGNPLTSKKISSATSEVTIQLRPASKVIRELRKLFPGAFLVGWKYESDFGLEEAVIKGRKQMVECQTDACVINGTDVDGFVYLTPDSRLAFPDKKSLAEFLATTGCSP